MSILTRVVSPDATIAIVFGLIGVILSLAGVVIACLTLRFIVTEKCMLPLLLLSFSLFATVLISVYINFLYNIRRPTPANK